MTDVLILGGTGWLSGRVAAAWAEEGARVTALARGGRPAPDGVDLVTGDRDDPTAYDAVRDRDWDEVVDISSRPEHVRAALAALSPRSRHWTYVSSLSVYAANDVVGQDESAPLAEPADPADAEYDYSRAKSAAEAAVRAAMGKRSAIVRPGLIVGPDDPTDRFGYWVSRFALAGDAPVLVPDAPAATAQVIDVDDLAPFIVRLGRERSDAVVNAISEPMPLGDLLAAARAVAGHTGPVVAADPAWLTAREVSHWAGPRSLPLWLPDDLPGFATHSAAAYRAAGGGIRPLDETLRRTLVDERGRGLDRTRSTGLTRDEELALLAELEAPRQGG